jgi:hypothetical protein
VLGAVLAILQPAGLLRAAGEALAHSTVSRPPAPMANRLTALVARVSPPAYSRLPATTMEDPSSVASLIGSRITLAGKGPADGVTATLGERELAAGDDRGGWGVGLTMPKEAVVVTLRDRAYRRLVVLEPVTDSAPAVKLRLPARDTTYQTVPRGKLAIDATLSDDVGLAYGYVEYMLSTGAEESFETKESTGPRVQFGNEREARSELGDAHAALVARLDRVAALARSDPAAARDSLTFIRVSALGSGPQVAGALEEAITRLRAGEPVERVLSRARRALEPRARAASGAAEWAGVMP